jgi:hypothetical protein
MSLSHYLPSKDKEFSVWAENFVGQLENLIEAIQFPKEEFDLLSEQQVDFAEKLITAETPATRTPIAVEAKNESRKILEKHVQHAVQEYLQHNHLVTDEQRKTLRIPIHKTTHTPSPVASTYPAYEVDTGTIRRLVFHYWDSATPKSKAKPAGQHGIEMWWAHLDAPPQSIDDLIHSVFDTKTPLVLEFVENMRGKIIYFCLRWENTRGEKGPWSEIASAIVP